MTLLKGKTEYFLLGKQRYIKNTGKCMAWLSGLLQQVLSSLLNKEGV